jgi:predicted flap endonuclease-1-like 5' DNA nuclease
LSKDRRERPPIGPGRDTRVSIADVEGIGPLYAEKLAAAGVRTTDALLERGATSRGRAELEVATGIGQVSILRWVNRVDLYRIKGIGSEYSDLLDVAGVDTVRELSQRNAAELAETLAEASAARSLVRRVPTVAEVTDWIAQAKQLPRLVRY